jgi:predicted kinase
MSERRPTLVIITGPPGAGKTTLARNLARQVSVPLIVKDDIKEALFDTLGWSDRAWSRKVGAASFEILWRLVDDHLALGISLMVETAFHQVPDSGRVESLVDRHGNSCVQVYVAAPPNILYERFRHRATSGDRHERHVDHLADYSTFQELYDRCSPLRIGAPLIEVDTIEFANVDTQAITDRLRPLL